MAGHRLRRAIRLASRFPPVPRDALAPAGVRAHYSISAETPHPRPSPAVPDRPPAPSVPSTLSTPPAPPAPPRSAARPPHALRAHALHTPSVHPPCACPILTQPYGCYTVATVWLLLVGGGRHGISRLAGRRLSIRAEPVR